MYALNNAEIEIFAPAAFAPAAADRMSSRYGFVSTIDAVEAMRTEGFVVTSAQQEKVRPGSMRDPSHTRHVVVLKHPDYTLGDEGHAQFILDNSHNGVSGLKAHLGFFRFVCSNGLVIGTSLYEERVRHTRNNAIEAIERIRALAANTAPMFERIARWSELEMSASAERDFAIEALRLRFGEDGAERYRPEAALELRREEDAKRTMWAVLNRVQENLVRPSPTMVGRSTVNRIIRPRGLSGLNANLAFNTSLWDLAENFSEAILA